VACIITDLSEELTASIIRVEGISVLGTTLVVIVSGSLQCASVASVC
jgi:hypothetical protein